MDSLVVNGWVDISAGCALRYHIDTSNSVQFVASNTPYEFEFFFDGPSLREFVALGTTALAELDARREQENPGYRASHVAAHR